MDFPASSIFWQGAGSITPGYDYDLEGREKRYISEVPRRHQNYALAAGQSRPSHSRFFCLQTARTVRIWEQGQGREIHGQCCDAPCLRLKTPVPRHCLLSCRCMILMEESFQVIRATTRPVASRESLSCEISASASSVLEVLVVVDLRKCDGQK